MIKGRISDWIDQANKTSKLSNRFYYIDNKIEDQNRLRNSILPTYNFLSLKVTKLPSYQDTLTNFFNKHKGIFLRIIPNQEGFKKGLKKRYTFGYYSLDYFLEFIKRILLEEPAYELIEFQEWEEDIYGWILISNGKKVIAEISESLDNLAHNNEIPISSCIAKTTNSHHNLNWIKKDNNSSILLEKAINSIVTKNSKDYFMKGYFEGVTTKSQKNRFFDWKLNTIYYTF